MFAPFRVRPNTRTCENTPHVRDRREGGRDLLKCDDHLPERRKKEERKGGSKGKKEGGRNEELMHWMVMHPFVLANRFQRIGVEGPAGQGLVT